MVPTNTAFWVRNSTTIPLSNVAVVGIVVVVDLGDAVCPVVEDAAAYEDCFATEHDPSSRSGAAEHISRL